MRIWCAAIYVLGTLAAQGGTGSLFAPSGAQAPIVALPGGDAPAAASASLFAGAAEGSFFAPWPERPVDLPPEPAGPGGSQVAALRALIATAEAGAAGYDAVQHGARVRPPRPPTQMTLAEIFAWIDATPGQAHAIGRYQVIPSTLRWLVTALKIGPEARFDAALQDRLADALLAQAGYGDFRQGRLGRHAFMHNLSRIWAGLPTATGASYYEGHADNRATMTWAAFDAAMARIFPG